MKEFLNVILLKPFIMLGESRSHAGWVNLVSWYSYSIALEPMLLATTLYMSYIYGIVYLLVSLPRGH